MLAYNFASTLELLPGIVKAINLELIACVYYMNLVELAPGNVEKELIDKIIEDDILGCNIYRDIYEKLAGCAPIVTTPRTPDIDDFEKGISKAYLDETISYRFYRNLYMSVGDEALKRVLYISMADKKGHAMNLLFMGAYSGSNE